jgi:DMSO/TMAO reductase YedYZ molybdopterin-dependent catalytic subunit
MECSSSDATYFDSFKGENERPTRPKEGMILSVSEWTGVPLAAVLNEARLTAKSLYVRAEGNDQGVPPTDAPGTRPFYYDKGLPIEKALHPDTILAWAQNGQLLEHLHGAPVRLLVPGWSGNWSVKWLTKLELTEQEPDCWYHYQFYYYGNSPEDPNKELITTTGVKIDHHPTDDDTET